MAGPGPNEQAVQRDLDDLGDERLAKSGLAATALTLARGLDSESSLTSKGQAAKSLQDILAELRALAPEKKEQDGLDEIAERRSRRRERKTAAQG